MTKKDEEPSRCPLCQQPDYAHCNGCYKCPPGHYSWCKSQAPDNPNRKGS